MLENVIKNYYKLFDETIESSTFIVLFITLIIFFVGAVIPSANAETQLLKTSILDAKRAQISSQAPNIIVIEWKKYEVYFSEITE